MRYLILAAQQYLPPLLIFLRIGRATKLRTGSDAQAKIFSFQPRFLWALIGQKWFPLVICHVI